ncbi:MAG: hypothetical protein LBU11_07420 [Zoogloeaceae bacterium]|nr:hypothetical protein [Zoogloeaceae bacterium]
MLRLCNAAMDRELSNTTRENALRQIETRCHVKWLGDLYLPELSLQEWWGQLEELRKSARKQRLKVTGAGGSKREDEPGRKETA